MVDSDINNAWKTNTYIDFETLAKLLVQINIRLDKLEKVTKENNQHIGDYVRNTLGLPPYHKEANVSSFEMSIKQGGYVNNICLYTICRKENALNIPVTKGKTPNQSYYQELQKHKPPFMTIARCYIKDSIDLLKEYLDKEDRYSKDADKINRLIPRLEMELDK